LTNETLPERKPPFALTVPLQANVVDKLQADQRLAGTGNSSDQGEVAGARGPCRFNHLDDCIKGLGGPSALCTADPGRFSPLTIVRAALTNPTEQAKHRRGRWSKGHGNQLVGVTNKCANLQPCTDRSYCDLPGADLSGARFCRTTMPNGTINNSGC
jgi:hypothetical protein